MSGDKYTRPHRPQQFALSAIVLLLFAASAFGKAKHFGQLFLETGAPRSGAKIYVFSGTKLAKLYEDSEGRVPLANPLTTARDGVYWFYADNGRYAIAEALKTGYKVIDPEVHVFDPSDPHTVTATSNEVALTLTHVGSAKAATNSSIVLRRDEGPEIESKGPWRMHYAGSGREPKAPRSFMLLYNTDLQKDAAGKETWKPRDIKDVCILYKITAASGTGGPGLGGYLRYAVAPSAPAGTLPVFKDALNVTGSPVNTASSLLKIGEGLANKRSFRNRYGNWVPFAFSTTFGGPQEPEPQKYGEVRVLDLDPAKIGRFKPATRKAEPHPQVIATGFLYYASAGEAFVKLAKGVTVRPGDTMVASAQSGCAEVDNSQMDATRIIGWAVERSGQTRDGYVFVILK